MRCSAAVIILSSLLLAFVSCRDVLPDGGGEDTGTLTGDTAVRTLVVYMMAENSLASFAATDIEEIREGAVSVPSDCRLFVFVDDCGNPRMLQFKNSETGVVEEVVVNGYNNDFCSSDTAALASVLCDLLDDYPTRALDLVLWSHGDGWLPDYSRAAPMRAIGIDNGKDSFSDRTAKSIEIQELAAVIERLPAKVDRLMFDACFMQSVEVAYALRDVVEWVIASPAEIPGDGAPYDTVVGEFFASDGVEGVIDAYKVAYEGETVGVVLSAAYMPAMQRLADVSYSIICNYFNRSKKREYIDVFAYLPGGASGYYGYMPCFYDANAVMRKYLTDGEFAVWKEALDAAVPYAVTTGCWYSAYVNRILPVNASVYSGISMYMPQATNRYTMLNTDFSGTEWYSAAGWDAAGW